YCARNYDWFAY
nr:immunoglobulin heavy chain junction region [Mus musculus]